MASKIFRSFWEKFINFHNTKDSLKSAIIIDLNIVYANIYDPSLKQSMVLKKDILNKPVMKLIKFKSTNFYDNIDGSFLLLRKLRKKNKKRKLKFVLKYYSPCKF